MSSIHEQVERSSLGTQNAKAARSTISTQAAADVVARASTIAQSNKTPPKKTGG